MLSLIFLDNFQLITVSSFSHVAKFCLLILWRPFLSMSMRDSGVLFLFFSLWCLFLGLVSGKNPNLNVLTGKFYQIFKEQILLIFHILFQKIEEWTFQLTLWDHFFLIAAVVQSLSHVRLFAIPCAAAPGSPIHGIFQAKILEWISISFSRGSSWLRDWTWVSCIAGRLFTVWATREALFLPV